MSSVTLFFFLGGARGRVEDCFPFASPFSFSAAICFISAASSFFSASLAVFFVFPLAFGAFCVFALAAAGSFFSITAKSVSSQDSFFIR